MSKYEYIGVNDVFLHTIEGQLRLKKGTIVELDDSSVDLVLFKKINEKKEKNTKGGNE
jgi:hypothetical protein